MFGSFGRNQREDQHCGERGNHGTPGTLEAEETCRHDEIL